VTPLRVVIVLIRAAYPQWVMICSSLIVKTRMIPTWTVLGNKSVQLSLLGKKIVQAHLHTSQSITIVKVVSTKVRLVEIWLHFLNNNFASMLFHGHKTSDKSYFDLYSTHNVSVLINNETRDFPHENRKEYAQVYYKLNIHCLFWTSCEYEQYARCNCVFWLL